MKYERIRHVTSDYLSVRELDNNWLFSIKKLNPIGDQFQMAEIIDLHHTETLKLFTSRSFILSTFCTGNHYNLKTN